MKTKRNIIGAWSISNVGSLNLYEIEHGINDRVLVGLTGATPEWRKITYDSRGEAFITYHGMIYHMYECMRIANFGGR